MTQPKIKTNTLVHPTGKPGDVLLPYDSYKMLIETYGYLFDPCDVELLYVTPEEVPDVWDQYYGDSEYCWEEWISQQEGGAQMLNGFAYRNRVYLVTENFNAGTFLHEVLHVNAHLDWKSMVGLPIDEGVTDFLKTSILINRGLWAPSSYPHEQALIARMCCNGISKELLACAYFQAGPALRAVQRRFDQLFYGTWAEFVDAAQKGYFSVAKLLVTRR